MYTYSKIECVELVRYAYSTSLKQAGQLFHEKYPEKPIPSKSVISKIVKRFEREGAVHPKPKSGRPKTVTTDNMIIDILALVEINPSIGIHKLALQSGTSYGSVQRVLASQKFHPYKLQLVNSLGEDDPDRRIEYCEIIQNKVSVNNAFLDQVLFTDECTFYLNSRVVRHNMFYWSKVNPHWFREIDRNNKDKLNVWAGIIEDKIIGPIFFTGTLTGEKYLELLQNEIGPELEARAEREELWYQHDGAPAHYDTRVREYLDQVFPGHWIGRRGEIEWPPRSPDLNPLDFFLWGYIKSEIYKTRPETIQELKERIINCCANISARVITKAIKASYYRLGFCLLQMGNVFEHLI